MNDPKIRLLAAVIAAITITITITVNIELASDSPGHGSAAKTIVTEVDGKDRDRKRDDKLTVPASAVKASAPDDQQLRDQTPAGAPASQVAEAAAAANEIRQTQRPLPTAGASQGFPGCVTRFVRNQSSRNGVRPQNIADHYTVSRNVPGWADVNGIVVFFNRVATAASSNFVIDAEGHCAYIVPIEAKAWTQAAGNPFTVSIEIIAQGNETRLMGPAGFAKLRQVHREIGRRTRIPMRRGQIRSCTPARTGIVQHADYGLCGGGHHDIRPFSINQIVKITTSGLAAARSATAKSSEPERRIVARRCTHYRRRFARGASAATRARELRASRQAKTAAGRQKRRLDTAHAHGQPWRVHAIGARRQAMARAERFNKPDRRALCR